MPPRGEPRRPKGVAGPASSARVASLVGGSTDPFAAFAAFGGTTGGVAASASAIHPELSHALQRLTKRDRTTKQKAAGELGDLIGSLGEDDVIAAVPDVCGGLRRHLLHKDKHVRRALCGCLQALFTRGKQVKRALVPQLPLLLGYWLMLRRDAEQDVEAKAEEAWATAFDSDARAAAALNMCVGPVCETLCDRIDMTPDELRADEGLSPDDAQVVAASGARAALLAFASIARLGSRVPAEGEKPLRWEEPVAAALLAPGGEGRLWKILRGPTQRPHPATRSAAYQLLACLLKVSPSVLEPCGGDVAEVMAGSVAEQDGQVHVDMWPACLLWLRHSPDALAAMPPKAQAGFLHRLCGLLRRTSGVAGSDVTYPSLLPLLTLIPREVFIGGDPSGMRAVGFFDTFFVSLWQGMRSESLPLSGVPGLLKAWVECWQWATKSAAELVPASAVQQLEASLVHVHAGHMLRRVLCSDDLRLPQPRFVAAVAPVLRRLAEEPRLLSPGLALWTDMLGLLQRPGTAPPPLAVPASAAPGGGALSAPAAPAGRKGRKKGDEVAVEYDPPDDVPATEFSLRRLGMLLGELSSDGSAGGSDEAAGFTGEFTILLGTHLVEVAGRALATGDSLASVAKVWRLCAWRHVPQLLEGAYRSVLAPALERKLLADAPDSDAARAVVDMCVPHFAAQPAQLAELLRRAAKATRPCAVEMLAAAVAAPAGGDLAAALEEAASECARRRFAADEAEWIGGVAAVLSLAGTERCGERCCDVALQAVRKGATEPVCKDAIRVAGAAACGEAAALATAALEALLQGGTASADTRQEWQQVAEAVSAAPEACTEVVRRSAKAGSCNAPLLADWLRLPALSGCAAALAADLPALWAEVGGVQWPAGAEELRPSHLVTLADPPACEPCGAAAAAAWSRSVTAVATHVIRTGAPPPLELVEHAAILAVVAQTDGLPEDVSPAPEVGALFRAGAGRDAVEAAARAALSWVVDGPDLLRFAGIAVLRGLCMTKHGRAAAVHAAVAAPDVSSWPVLSWLERVCSSGQPGEGARDGCAGAVSEWAAAVAERDEVSGDVTDAEAVAALRAAQWAACGESAALSSCAWEKVQEPVECEPGHEVDAFRLRLALLDALLSTDGEDAPATVAEVAEAAARLVATYAPATQAFAWEAPEGATRMPLDPPIAAEALGRVLRCVSRPGVAPAVAAQLASAGLDAACALSDASAEVACLSAARGAEEIAAALLQLRVADEQLLNVQWKDVLCGHWNQIARRLLARGIGETLAAWEHMEKSTKDTGRGRKPEPVEEELRRAAGLWEEKDEDAAAAGTEIQLLSPDEALMGLISRFGSITSSADASAAAADDEKAAPGPIAAQLELLAGLGDELARSGRVLERRGGKLGRRHLLDVWDLVTHCVVLPHTHAMLVGWRLLLEWLGRESRPAQAAGTASTAEADAPGLRTAGCVVELLRQRGPCLLPVLMEVIGALLTAPREGVEQRLGSTAQFRGRPAGVFADALLGVPSGLPAPEALSRRLDSCCCGADAGLAAVYMLWLLLGNIPASPRRWVSDCDPSVRDAMHAFVQVHLSTSLIGRELAHIRERGGAETFPLGEGVTVKVSSAPPSVGILYDYQDAVVTVRMMLPPAFPLVPVQLNSAIETQLRRSGVSDDVWRKWVMQMTVSLISKSAGLWGCVLLWWQNLDKHFAGQEPCPICYQVVSSTSHQLPSMPCQCCSGKFHKVCLYRWFTKSNDSTCPLCRSPWYAGGVSAARPQG
eukprot:TRINITY_DN35561_c0_g1_i1.p1 TRINITY_DN35561_c0_g1~~TRINITY_DN35561_c0_g1_i1.p1  ORF type:complete len:1757 (+),score=610.57 TRINITY_DN35561_c0_g1_i1:71-5341(+)